MSEIKDDADAGAGEKVLQVAAKLGYIEMRTVGDELKCRLTDAGRKFLENHRDFDELIEVHEFCEEDNGEDEEEENEG